jgi:hypothetical protein
MSRNLAFIVVLAAVAPLAVDTSGPESTAVSPGGTLLRASAGAASYAFLARGCNGQVLERVRAHAQDASVSIDQPLGVTGVHVGARAGSLRDRIDTTSSERFAGVPAGRTTTNRYVNPYLAYERAGAGIGAGALFHEREFLTAGERARTERGHAINDVSLHLRLGPDRGPHFIGRWMESEPLYSGGGYLTLGIGGTGERLPLSFEVGLAAGGPYEGAGGFLKSRWQSRSGLGLDVAGRGGAEGSGASVGVRYQFPPPAPAAGTAH